MYNMFLYIRGYFYVYSEYIYEWIRILCEHTDGNRQRADHLFHLCDVSAAHNMPLLDVCRDVLWRYMGRRLLGKLLLLYM